MLKPVQWAGLACSLTLTEKDQNSKRQNYIYLLETVVEASLP